MRPLATPLAALALLAACSGSDATDAGAGADGAAPPAATGAPATAAPASAAPAEEAAGPALADWLREHYPDAGDILTRSGEVDLDGDGTSEILVYVGGPMLCGSGGCNLVVLRHAGGGLEAIGELSVVQLPVGVFPESTGGWRDLAVSVSGGGIAGGVARVPFADGRYAANPTVPPARMTTEPFETVIGEGPLEPLG